MELVNELATVRASLARSAEHDVALRAAAARADSAAMLLLSGRSPAAAAAALASIVSAAARSADVRLGAVQWSTDSSSGFLGRARVRAEGEGDVRGLTRLLLALERGPVALRISELTVAQPDPEATDDVAEALRFQFVIDGLYLRSVTAGGDGDA